MKKSKKRSEMKTFTGKLSITRKGYGFVDVSKNNGIFVSESNMNGGFEGDLVRAKMINLGRKPECEIVEILERGFTSITGIYNSENKTVLPYNSKLNIEFKVKKEHVNGAVDGDLVVCDILSYGNGKKLPSVYIREVLGALSKKGNDITVIMRKYGIHEEFPNEVLTQKIDDSINGQELQNREDYTNRTVITIDGEDAKDLDDAVSVEVCGEHYVLGVHIADVSHYVKGKTPVDREAYFRGTSVYLPDRVAPMLPKSLSNGLCSLNPNEIKLTLSCVMIINKEGKILEYEIKKTYIKSAARMTYKNVKRILDGEHLTEYAFLNQTLKDMYDLYKILREKRKTKGFIAFDFPESKFRLDENGRAVDVFPYEISEANEIIEEFMLAANISAADFGIKNKLPFVFRVHDKPDIEKIQSLYTALKVFDLDFKPKLSPSPKELGQVIEKASDTAFKNIIHQLALRAMQKAVYSHECSLHYGLNFKKYSHFTSPIRRYPDLMVHRIISDFLDGKQVDKYKRFVASAALQSSETELNAFMCEREADDLKKAEYMSNKIGQIFEGTISGMVDTGFFVALSNTVEGFVPLAALMDDYYEYKEGLFAVVGRKNKNKFMIGQQVSVKLAKVDILNKKVDFILN